MIDLHTHTILSDGELLPSELARRYEEKGFKAVAITDHADLSNIKMVTEAVVNFCGRWPEDRIKVVAGIELTHLPLNQFKECVDFARSQGIKLIVAHGETIVEPVMEGTVQAALKAGVDIIAHPGLISEEDVKLAHQKGIFLELSARQGHCLGNGHVAGLALKYAAKLCINSDAHSVTDIPTRTRLKEVGLGAGLELGQIGRIEQDIEELLIRITK